MQTMTAIRKFEKVGDDICILFSTEDLKKIGIEDPSKAEIEISAEKNHIILRPANEKYEKESK